MNSLKISLQNTFTHVNTIRLISWFTAALSLVPSLGQAQPTLIAVGSLTESRAGANADLSGLTYSLENQAPANLLGGLGSAITYNSGSKFLLLAGSRSECGHLRRGDRQHCQLCQPVSYESEPVFCIRLYG
jgi:hypothetical protein